MASTVELINVLLIISISSSDSLNRPNFSSCAKWSQTATTFLDKNSVGQYPIGIFINEQNTVYVTNRDNGNILVQHNGTVKVIPTNLTNPWSLFVTISNDIYVDNGFSNGHVEKWTSNTTNRIVIMNVDSSCTGLFVDTGNSIYCSLADKHRIFKVGLINNTNNLITVAGTPCPGPVSNMLDHPHGIFVDNNLNLYVADSHNNRVQRFAPDQTNAVTVAGFATTMTFLLNKPTSIVLDADGNLFIVDSHNHRIIRSIGSNFECLVGCSGESGTSANHLYNPQTMAFDSMGNIFVTDFNNHRIQEFHLTQKSCARLCNFTLAPMRLYPTVSCPDMITVGDFNNDNQLDIAAAIPCANSHSVDVFLGYGNGTFATKITSSASGLSSPYAIATGDFNNDHRVDVALSDRSGTNLGVLLGNGDGTFQAIRTFSTGFKSFSIAVGDFNNDSQLDIAITESNSVGIFLGYGNGNFQAQTTYATGSSPYSVAVADVNNDNIQDLVVANKDSNTVSVLLGYGNGTFKTQITFATGSTPYSVAVGDFNGDYQLDVVVANEGGNTVSVLLGYGNGTFATQMTFATGSSPYSVAVGDFNGDNQLDITVANFGNNNVGVLLGYGNGTFKTQMTFAASTNPWSMAVGDFNNDGLLDIADGNGNGPSIGVFLTIC